MEESILQSRTDLSELGDAVQALRTEIKKIIVGQDDMVKLIITALLADGHVLLEGVPGTAKTLTAKLVAQSVAVPFSRIQFTPDLMPSDVLGTPVFNPKEGRFEFKQGPIFSNIILIDEINRAPAKTQAALFEVMEERQVTIDGTSYGMQAPFMVIATQNPIEQEGTYRLPEAQLDRFLFKIKVPYPSLEEEIDILQQSHNRGNAPLFETITPLLNALQIVQLRQQVKTIYIDDKLLRYIGTLVHKTRHHKSIYLGASTRASLSMMFAAKAMAAINGRDFVTPEDILEVVAPVLRHRLLLTPEKEMEGITEDAVIKSVIAEMDIPR